MTKAKTTDTPSLKNALKELEAITEWLESDAASDIETGLEKVREGVALVRITRARLADLENQFTELKAELDDTPSSPTYATEEQ